MVWVCIWLLLLARLSFVWLSRYSCWVKRGLWWWCDYYHYSATPPAVAQIIIFFFWPSWIPFLLLHIVWKSPQMSHLNFSILAFSTNFCPTKIDLSGITVWPQAWRFQKLAKLSIFGIFNQLLPTQNVKGWMRLFLWFSKTVSFFLSCSDSCGVLAAC